MTKLKTWMSAFSFDSGNSGTAYSEVVHLLIGDDNSHTGQS